MRICKGQLRGSTEAVMATTLPNLMADDSLNMSTTLKFQVRNASRMHNNALQKLSNAR